MNEDLKVKGEELLATIKGILHEGNARRVIIKDEKGNTFLEIPVTIGVIGVVISPILAAVGALAALATSFNIQIVKKDEE
jgi:hypothetical protein